MVKEDKTSNCYSFHRLLENLKEMTAEETALAIRGRPENLSATNGFDLIFNSGTRFNCIKSFRDKLNEDEMKTPGYKAII